MVPGIRLLTGVEEVPSIDHERDRYMFKIMGFRGEGSDQSLIYDQVITLESHMYWILASCQRKLAIEFLKY